MTFLETCEVTALGSREKGGNEQACSCVQSVVCLYVMFICGVHICLYEVCACVCVCVYVSHLLYPFTYRWILMLILYLDNYK